MQCQCGFKFAGPGEFRNCNAFVTDKGESGIICPACGRTYIVRGGSLVKVEIRTPRSGD